MTRYIIRRLLQAIPLLFIISVILFALMRASGDPVATMGGRKNPRPEDRERLSRLFGLDQPLFFNMEELAKLNPIGALFKTQYGVWLVGNDWTKIDMDGDGIPETPGSQKGVLRGDFGKSVVSRGKSALDIVMERVGNTLLLMTTAEIVIIVFSIAIGVFSALRQYSLIDHVITALSFIGYSMPIFFIALLTMYIFAVKFKQWGLPYLPTVGMFDPKVGKTPAQVAYHLILPVFSIAAISIAGYSRFVRATMLEVMGEDYVRTAKAKGLHRRTVVFLHAFKNASLPLVTIIGLDIPLLLGGAVVTESIFGWPGMGRLFLDHVSRADTAVVMGILILISIAVIVFQLITDITYAGLDPRIRYE